MSVFEFLRYQKAKKREQQSLQRNKTNVFLSVFSSCYGPKRQNACKGTYMGKRKRILREMCITSVFELLRYENAKTLVQDSVWINRTTLPKTCILGVFFYMVRYQNAKMYANPLHGEMKRRYQKRVFCVFFQRIKHQHAKQFEKQKRILGMLFFRIFLDALKIHVFGNGVFHIGGIHTFQRFGTKETQNIHNIRFS